MAVAGKVLDTINELLKRGYSKTDILQRLGFKQSDSGEWLDMSEAARMQRASEQGYIPTYHGTTVDVPESGFVMEGTAESDLGRGIYSSTSPHDASRNYAMAETSQDLQGKIERLAEQIEVDEDVSYDVAKQMAAKRLVKSPRVMPTMVRAENPVRIGGRGETYFDFDYKMNLEDTIDEAEEKIREEYADDIAEGFYDEDELKEMIEDRARDIAYEYGYEEEASGAMADLFEGMRNAAHRFDDLDVEKVIMDVQEAHPDGASAAELIDTIKASEGAQYAMESDTGEMASGEFIRQAFEGAGYDSIIDATPNQKWGSGSRSYNPMSNLEGTEHVIAFDPSQMRSKYAAFDPEKKHLPNLTAGLASLGIGLASLGQSGESEAALPSVNERIRLANSGLGRALTSDRIEAARAPWMVDVSNALRYVNTPLGRPFENLADWAMGAAYQDEDKLSRAMSGALDVM